MGVIYIVSVEEGAGKTAVCAGLARIFKETGKNPGYLKPQTASHDGADADLAFMKGILGTVEHGESTEDIKGKDIVLVEATLGSKPDDIVSRTTYGAAREMKAGVVAVETWNGGDSPYVDVYKGFGEQLIGVLVNKVPVSQISAAREKLTSQFAASGIKLLATLPEDRRLLAVTVGQLAERINGTILNNPEKTSDLIENYMLGALVVDSGLIYFGRKNRKAAIVRQDRPDMQLAALETDTTCLVLGGSSTPPLYNVLQRAEHHGIPVITTDIPVKDIAADIDDMVLAGRLDQEQKLSGMAELVKKNLDVSVLA